MIDIATATPRTPCTYDHRLRDQVVRSGTRCLPKHVAIPRSTVATWRRRGSRPVATIEPMTHDRQQLVAAVAKLNSRSASSRLWSEFFMRCFGLPDLPSLANGSPKAAPRPEFCALSPVQHHSFPWP